MSELHQIEQLLPWYVTGRLDVADVERVESYLKEHPEARTQLNLIREEMGVVVGDAEATVLPASVNFNNLMQGIKEEENSRRVAKSGAGKHSGVSDLTFFDNIRHAPFVKSLLAWISGNELSVLRYGMVAASVALVVMAGIIGTSLNRQPTDNNYQTASGPQTLQNAPGKKLLISFTDQATSKEITLLLEEIGAEIVAGPKAGGIYTIKFSDPDIKADEIATIIEKLQKRSQLVEFVGSTK